MNASTPLLNPIAVAIEPRRQASVDRAVAAATVQIDRAVAELAAAGFDLNVVAPRPGISMSRANYRQAQARRGFFSSISRSERATHHLNDPVIVVVDQEGIARVLENAARDAGFEFDAYVAKLSAKIGAVTAAAIDDAPLWDGSRLTVTKTDGTTEVWKTTMILNVSSLGKLFNQWPTRRIA